MLFIFIIYVYKITDNSDKRYNISFNKTFSMSSSSITNTKTIKITQDNFFKYNNFILLKLIYKYKKVF